jgi:hypothetical protein
VIDRDPAQFNLSGPESAQDEAEAGPRRVQRLVIGALAVLVVVSMVGIPLVRILDWNQGADDGTNLAAENTALVFADAVLARRSVSRAMQVARAELRSGVEELVFALQRVPAAALVEAESVVQSVSCRHDWPPGSVCYEAVLAQPGRPAVLTMRFAVAELDGLALVVAVARVNSVTARLLLPAHGEEALGSG